VTAGGLVAEGDPVQLELGLDTGSSLAAAHGPDRTRWDAVDRAADELRARFGDGAVRLASLMDEPDQAYQEAQHEPRARRDLR
jgi:hypothetical protein